MKLVERNRGSITDYDEAKRWHEDACRSWRLLSQCWYWLCGPGKDDPKHTLERDYADGDRHLAGWTVETLREARAWNERHPIPKFPYRKPAKSVATSNKSRSFETGSETEDIRAALLNWTPTVMVARDWVAQFGGPARHIEILTAHRNAAEAAQAHAAARFYSQAIRDIERGADSVAAVVGPVVEILDTPNPDDQPW